MKIYFECIVSKISDTQSSYLPNSLEFNVTLCLLRMDFSKALKNWNKCWKGWNNCVPKLTDYLLNYSDYLLSCM